MKTLKIFLGSVVVYLCVATLHGCEGPRSHTVGTGGRPNLGSSAASGSGATGHTGGSSATITGTGGTTNGTGGTSIVNPVDEANAEVSGTRLKAQRFKGSDGSIQFEQWYDTMLDLVCSFAIAADANVHCLPSQVAQISTTFFSDSYCTVPLAYTVGACSTPPTYTVSTTTTTCPAEEHVFVTGAGYTGFLFESSGTCTSISAAAVPSYKFFKVGAEVSPSTFVSATVVQDP